jgi:hypothetical protein
MLLYYTSKTTLAKIVALSDARLHRVLRTLDLVGNGTRGAKHARLRSDTGRF